VWIDRVLASRTTRAVELSAMFTEERHRVLAENVANIDTPDYATRHLDRQAFQRSLRVALDEARGDARQRVNLRDNAQFSTAPDGRTVTRPQVGRAQNVLFHDGTHARLETLMADVAQNALSHELALNLLKSRYGSLQSAIRGRTG